MRIISFSDKQTEGESRAKLEDWEGLLTLMSCFCRGESCMPWLAMARWAMSLKSDRRLWDERFLAGPMPLMAKTMGAKVAA